MWLTILLTAGVVLFAGVAVAGWYAWNNLTSARRDAAKVERAGFTRRQVALSSGTTLTYSEGPASGRALVLIHGQGSARQSYDRALPLLAKCFHVFAVGAATLSAASILAPRDRRSSWR